MQLKTLLLPLLAAACLSAQPPAAPKITHVLATLSLKEGVTREKIAPIMQSEVRDTVNLYLEGKIQQWYSRGDGKGVVFLLDCKSVDEAKAILDKLPPADFIRVHRSFIISFSRIERVRNKAITVHGTEIPIGASYEENFQKRLRGE